MKKAFFVFAFMAMIAMTAAAKSVVFTLANGTLVYYLIGGERNPIMKFVDGKCVVNADTYEFSNIQNFYISETDDPAAIKTQEMTKEFSYKDNVLVVKADGKPVRVYNVSGAKADAEVSVNDGYATVNLSQCGRGAYVIVVGDSSFKVVKK